MNNFKVNAYGGVDVFNEQDKFLLHLSNEDLKTIYKIQQEKQDIDKVRDRISTWVDRQIEDDYEFADFNSLLFSDDEISAEQICQKILNNNGLVSKIVAEYRDILDNPRTTQGLQVWAYADEAIGAHVSITDIMGEILCDKQPKELCIGKWRVAVVEQGETVGSYGTAVHDNIKPVVEFYDMSQDKAKFPNGQFTGGRYFIETLLNSDIWSESIDEMVKRGVGLCLYGDVPAWTVASEELGVIASWLHKVQDKLSEKSQEKVEDVENTLESKLSSAQERSRQSVSSDTIDKNERDVEK